MDHNGIKSSETFFDPIWMFSDFIMVLKMFYGMVDLTTTH